MWILKYLPGLHFLLTSLAEVHLSAKPRRAALFEMTGSTMDMPVIPRIPEVEAGGS